MIDASDLTDELIYELDEFLLSDQSPDDCMQLSELDGFLTGIVVGPELIMPSEWLEIVWQGEPAFRDEQQAERILGIIMARYNQIICQLDDVPGAFEPILFATGDGTILATEWAEGFMDAFGLRVDVWDPMFQDEEAKLLMVPLMAHLHDQDGNPLIEGSPEELKEIRKECAQALPYAATDIYDFWKARRQPGSSTTAVRTKEPGRNDPCPCGSGQKYKRCCGSNRNTIH